MSSPDTGNATCDVAQTLQGSAPTNETLAFLLSRYTTIMAEKKRIEEVFAGFGVTISVLKIAASPVQQNDDCSEMACAAQESSHLGTDFWRLVHSIILSQGRPMRPNEVIYRLNALDPRIKLDVENMRKRMWKVRHLFVQTAQGYWPSDVALPKGATEEGAA